jgi:AcrR family transcriptional regulator
MSNSEGRLTGTNVAKRVGVSKSMIHHCLRTKEHLFEAVLEEANRLLLDAINAAIKPDASPDARLSGKSNTAPSFPAEKHSKSGNPQ